MGAKKITKGCTFLVLMDSSDASIIALKYTITLAKVVQGKIKLFHVARPTDIFSTHIQVGANKDIEKATHDVRKKLKAMTEMIATEGIQSSFNHQIGNSRVEIENELNTKDPIVVVMGKASPLYHDNTDITNYLYKQYDGHLLIVGQNSKFHNNTNIALAVNETVEDSKIKLVTDLAEFSMSPLTICKINSNCSGDRDPTLNKNWEVSNSDNIKVEHYINANFEDGVIEFISKNKPQLLCLGKNKKRQLRFSNLFNKHSCVSNMINKINVPVLVLN